jgi:hypothetical protein
VDPEDPIVIFLTLLSYFYMQRDDSGPIDQSDPRHRRPILISRQFHRQSKAAINAGVVFVVVSCLLYDWDSYLGTNKHVFGG